MLKEGMDAAGGRGGRRARAKASIARRGWWDPEGTPAGGWWLCLAGEPACPTLRVRRPAAGVDACPTLRVWRPAAGVDACPTLRVWRPAAGVDACSPLRG